HHDHGGRVCRLCDADRLPDQPHGVWPRRIPILGLPPLRRAARSSHHGCHGHPHSHYLAAHSDCASAMIRRVLRGTTAAIIIALALGLAAWTTGRIVTDRWAWSQWLWWIPTPFALAA